VGEDVQGTIKGGNGERLEFKLGTKSIGLTTKDLLSFVLVAAMAVGFYLAFTALTKGQDLILIALAKAQDLLMTNQQEGFRKFEHLLDIVHTNQTAILADIARNRTDMSAIEREQNTLLATQTQDLNAALQAQAQAMHADMVDLQRRLATLNWNQGRPPEERLPLELAPPSP
jgi:hypothetical protein